MVRHYPSKFGSTGHCGSGYILVLVYHVILQERVIKGS